MGKDFIGFRKWWFAGQGNVGLLCIQCRVRSQDGKKLEPQQDKNRRGLVELGERVFESCKGICRTLCQFLALHSLHPTLQEAINARTLALGEVYPQTCWG